MIALIEPDGAVRPIAASGDMAAAMLDQVWQSASRFRNLREAAFAVDDDGIAALVAMEKATPGFVLRRGRQHDDEPIEIFDIPVRAAEFFWSEDGKVQVARLQ